WGHALLTTAQRRLFRRLALFPGGASAEAISAVCGDRGPAVDTAAGRPEEPPEEAPQDVLGDLAALVERHLVQALAADEAEEPRFGVLHTLQAAARERLAASGEEATFRQRHAEYFRTLAVGLQPDLRGPRRARTVAQAAGERDNLLMALRWLAGQEHRAGDG